MTEHFIKWEFNDKIYDTLIRLGRFSQSLGRIFESRWHLIINPHQSYQQLQDIIQWQPVCILPNLHRTLNTVLYLHRNVDYLENRKNVDNEIIKITFTSGIDTLFETTIRCESNIHRYDVGQLLYKSSRSPPVQVNMKFIKTDRHDREESNIPETSLNMQTSSEECDLCCTKELSEDFQAMAFEEHLSDVTVKCNSTSFKAHKLVLCARSPVFKAMFVNAMQEKATDTVTLDDENPETVRSVIQFMYSGQIHINSIKEATSLLDLAEKYQIQSLKDGLIDYFKSNLSLQNAMLILELADLYDKNLKENAIKFIANHLDVLKQEQSWKDLKSSKPSLALEVYDNLH